MVGVRKDIIAVYNTPIIMAILLCPVDIVPENCDPVFLRKGGALTDLTFNTLLPLVIRGIPSIDDSFDRSSHDVTLLSG